MTISYVSFENVPISTESLIHCIGLNCAEVARQLQEGKYTAEAAMGALSNMYRAFCLCDSGMVSNTDMAKTPALLCGFVISFRNGSGTAQVLIEKFELMSAAIKRGVVPADIAKAIMDKTAEIVQGFRQEMGVFEQNNINAAAIAGTRTLISQHMAATKCGDCKSQICGKGAGDNPGTKPSNITLEENIRRAQEAKRK